MTLEAEIALLNQRASDLIETFENKETAINQTLSDAVSAAPDMHKVFTVDPINGSDSTGLGTDASPFQSLKKAVDSVPESGSGYIKLAPQETYIIDENISYSNKQLLIYPFGSIQSDNDKPLLSFIGYNNGSYNAVRGFASDNLSGNLIFVNCRLSVDDSNLDNQINNSSANALITNTGNSTGSRFYLKDCLVELKETGTALVKCNVCVISITIRECDFSATSGNIVDTSTSGLALVSVSASTKDAGANWYNDPALVLSNV